jgi:hypothetical protein
LLSSSEASQRTTATEGVNEFNHRWSQGYDVERRKQAEHQREHELDGDLCRSFLGSLSPLGPRHVRVGAKGIRDTRTEAIRLHQHCNQTSHVLDLRSCSKVLERFDARLSGSALDVDQMQLLGERRMGDTEFLGALENGLVDSQSGFQADNQEIERVR